MGGVFARAFLRAGHPVYPVTRDMDLAAAVMAVPEPALILVAVAERDMHQVLGEIPEIWRDRLALLQNELLPRDWLKHGLEHPTVVSAWFEKKKGSEVNVILPSPVFGPSADLVREALGTLAIPCRVLGDEDALLHELVLKNLYILTSNIAGLLVGGTVGELWSKHRELAEEIAGEVLLVQAGLTGRKLAREPLMEALGEAFAADPGHQCLGRSAPARLARVLEQAEASSRAVPRLREIHARQD